MFKKFIFLLFLSLCFLGAEKETVQAAPDSPVEAGAVLDMSEQSDAFE